MKNEIIHDHNHDGIDRRGFLKCMAWAGTNDCYGSVHPHMWGRVFVR